MEIKFDYGFEAKVPKIFLKEFREDRKEEIKKGELQEEDLFFEWLEEKFGDRKYDYYGKIVDKEIALFLIAEHLGTDYGDGGYPRDEVMEFKDNEFKYIIVCFGWANGENMKGGGYNFIGWKEKIK